MENISTQSITKDDSKVSGLVSWIKFVAILGIAYFAISNSVGLTRVNGESMDPTLKNGSLILLNKFSAHFAQPHTGDVVVIHEEANNMDIIKRVIAVPGETVAIQKGQVYVNGIPLPEISTLGTSNEMSRVTVEPGKVFVMGDNRTPGASLDSRDPSVGQLPLKDIKGYAAISLYPMYKIAKPLN